MNKNQISKKETFIPATKRPDGTWRKARRIKEGYVPQEEIPLYESKGKQFAQRLNTLPPGMCPIIADLAKSKREKLAQKTAKIKESEISSAKQQIKITAEIVETTDLLTEKLNGTLHVSTEDQISSIKTLKKYRKKLREIEAIEEKIKIGNLKQLDPDQLEKIKKKNDIIKEIKRLENEEDNQFNT